MIAVIIYDVRSGVEKIMWASFFHWMLQLVVSQNSALQVYTFIPPFWASEEYTIILFGHF